MVGFCDPPKEYQFKPGQSGNPSGAAKGYKSFKTRIRELSEKEINYKDLDNKTIRTQAGEALILSLLGKAIYKGDVQAAKALMEYSEDKLLDITTNGKDIITDKIVIDINMAVEGMYQKIDNDY